ncbi:MAG: response regulator [Firmicutes bacterium]|nr:response regulator [Alicyclobacillaceae bacterium]MCL6496310.1 response regulator [Bacillota bacterium]
MKILVVDDAAFMRLRLRKLLEDQGHTVVEAGNGREALDRYRAERPDLVLMDITMPEMDGIEAVRALTAEDPEARVVMVSALGQQAMVLAAIQAGAKDFIVKPFQPDRVLAAVSKWGRHG